METLIKIQSELKVPKSQYNSFGKYKYRSCEDIVESVKPLLLKYGCLLTLSDELVCIGSCTFVEATATFIHGEFKHQVKSSARLAQQKKGMDDAQITGSTSSYARKYALNGLFCIDDNKDSDVQIPCDDLILLINSVQNVDELKNIWENNPEFHNNTEFSSQCSKMKEKLFKNGK